MAEIFPPNPKWQCSSKYEAFHNMGLDRCRFPNVLADSQSFQFLVCGERIHSTERRRRVAYEFKTSHILYVQPEEEKVYSEWHFQPVILKKYAVLCHLLVS